MDQRRPCEVALLEHEAISAIDGVKNIFTIE
jgi:hypothetical protein